MQAKAPLQRVIFVVAYVPVHTYEYTDEKKADAHIGVIIECESNDLRARREKIS